MEVISWLINCCYFLFPFFFKNHCGDDRIAAEALLLAREQKSVRAVEMINRVKFRDNKPGSLEVSGDQNPGQWSILRLHSV